MKVIAVMFVASGQGDIDVRIPSQHADAIATA
jgi:hypothetical protein